MKNRMFGNMKSKAMIVCLLATLAIASQAFGAKQGPATPVDVNQASVEQLMSIPGIGASKAQAIVAYRTNTPFVTANDLTNVKGIGDKLLAKIAPFVTVSGSTQTEKPGTAGNAVR